MGKPEEGLDAQKAERGACLMEKLKALGLENLMVA
jgi:hypothetical protein